MVARPSGRTVTKRPGCRSIILAAIGEMGLPKRQKRRPFCFCSFAHTANSSGDGMWPRSAAQRRTIKPSIIFGAPFLPLETPFIPSTLKYLRSPCKKARHLFKAAAQDLLMPLVTKSEKANCLSSSSHPRGTYRFIFSSVKSGLSTKRLSVKLLLHAVFPRLLMLFVTIGTSKPRLVTAIRIVVDFFLISHPEPPKPIVRSLPPPPKQARERNWGGFVTYNVFRYGDDCVGDDCPEDPFGGPNFGQVLRGGGPAKNKVPASQMLRILWIYTRVMRKLWQANYRTG